MIAFHLQLSAFRGITIYKKQEKLSLQENIVSNNNNKKDEALQG